MQKNSHLSDSEMKNCVFIFAIVLFGIRTRNGHGQKLRLPGETRYVLRILNYTALDWTGQPYLENLKWTVRNMQQYLSANVTARRDYTLRRVFVVFERCRDFEIGCENFQTWNASKEICIFFRLKNQVWSTLMDAIDLKRFPETCPRIEKGIYEVKNATFDMNWLLMFYSDAPKYYWKVHTFFYNERNEIEYQCHGLGHIISYTKRKRIPFQRRGRGP